MFLGAGLHGVFMDNSNQKKSEGDSGKVQEPHWSLAANFTAAVIIVAISTIIVMVVLKKPVWIELEIAVGIIGIAMFGFFTWVLYHGVLFSPDETLTITFSRFDPNLLAHSSDPGVFMELGTAGFAEGGPFGCLAGFLLGAVLCMAAAVVVWFFSNFFFAGITILTLPLFYIFRWSVFFILRHSVECRGQLGRSVKYGAGYAFVKAGTLYVIIYGAHLINVVVKVLLTKG
jgi:hypothetical protein